MRGEAVRLLLKDDELCESLCQARDLVSLMFRLQSMPLVDLLYLHWGDLHTDATSLTVLTCPWQRTGTPLQVTLTAEALALIDRYRSTDPASLNTKDQDLSTGGGTDGDENDNPLG